MPESQIEDEVPTVKITCCSEHVSSVFSVRGRRRKPAGQDGAICLEGFHGIFFLRCLSSIQSTSDFFICSWAHSGPMMGIILLSHYCPLMNKKRRNKPNPTLSIGSAPPTESPRQDGVPVTPQVFASCLSRDPTSMRPGQVNCHAAGMQIVHRLQSTWPLIQSPSEGGVTYSRGTDVNAREV